MIGIVDADALDYTQMVGVYIQSNGYFGAWEKAGFTSDNVNSGGLLNTEYTIRCEIQNDGTVTISKDGTVLGHTVVATSGDYTAKNLRGMVVEIAKIGTLGTFDLNDYLVDDAADPNVPPDVDAGTDQVIEWPIMTAVLHGSADDDGFPLDPGALTFLWEIISSPVGANVIFSDVNVAEPSIEVDLPGAYVFRLTADDGELHDTDSVVVTFNQPPTLNMGDDLIANIGEPLTLHPIVDDDFLPDPPGALSFLWEQIEGEFSVDFDSTTVQDAVVTAYLPGTYVLKLTVSDGADEISRVVRVRVQMALNELLCTVWTRFLNGYYDPDTLEGYTCYEKKRLYYKKRLELEIDDTVADNLPVDDYMDQFLEAAGYGSKLDGGLDARERTMFILEADLSQNISWSDAAKAWAIFYLND